MTTTRTAEESHETFANREHLAQATGPSSREAGFESPAVHYQRWIVLAGIGLLAGFAAACLADGKLGVAGIMIVFAWLIATGWAERD